MKRRIWLLVLALVMALSALPVTAAAEAEDAHTQLQKIARKSYTASLSSYKRSSFHGYCATMVAYQLRHLEITKKADLCNGNEMYDLYKNKTKTSGGYFVQPYSAKNYSLEEALNAISVNGTKDVYNILVGFQWTSTSAGRRYGHAVLINGILDGTVYFVESFDSADIGPEGTVGKMSISKFAKIYGKWTKFEGCIHFTKDYAESLERWETELFVRANQAQYLYSQPAPLGEQESHLLRSITAGELLSVTAVLRDREGLWYYAVQDGDYLGYVPAQAVTLERVHGESLNVVDMQIPQNINPGEALKLSGEARSACGKIRALQAVVTNASGENVAWVEQGVGERVASLDQLELPELPAGAYTLSVTAAVDTPYVTADVLEETTQFLPLLEMYFWAGPMTRTDHVRGIGINPPVSDGWFRQNNTWYYYENGQPRTGWLWEQGNRYYLDATGAVTTGWAVIDGQTCLFSANGALCTGWILDVEGMRYCSNEGRFVNGWINIDGGRYYFEEGLLQTEGILSDGVEVYQLQANGPATLLTEE